VASWLYNAFKSGMEGERERERETNNK